ncbi:MAG: PD-(D/E)XK nuclease family protein, partial [Cyanobacteria bacterium J06648_11]
QIIDWKTYRQPAAAEHLQQHWQTRLYLSLLAEHLTCDRSELSMTYWFSEAPERTVVIPYGDAAYDRDRADIQHSLERLHQWMQDGSFPEAEPFPEPLLAVDMMPELPLP